MKPTHPDNSARQSAPHEDRDPTPDEIQALVSLFIQRRYTEAAALAQTMTARFPRHAFGWKVLGAAFKQMGRSADALAPMQEAAALSPGDAEAQSNLGATLFELGRLDEAEASCRRVLEIRPDFAGAHFNLGTTLRNLGRLDEAEVSYRRALEIKPDYFEAHTKLGLSVQDLGRLDEAEASHRRALQIMPHYVEAHNNLGGVLKDLGRLEEAESSYRRALQIKPDYVEAHNNLGNILKDLGRLEEAEASYRQALRIRPDLAETHNNLGTSLHDMGRLDEAEASYRQALAIKPEIAQIHCNLGNTLYKLGRLDEAEASYRHALEIKPDCLAYAANTHLLLPVIPNSVEDLASWRERYRRGIGVLATGRFADDPDNLDQHSFYLAYHNQNDKPLMEALNKMFRKHVTRLTATAPHVLDWRAPVTSNRRIRVGILSRFLVSHTIGKLFQGFIRELDRRRFEVVVIHAPKAKRDVFRQHVDASADKVLTLPPRLEDQQALLMAERLDVLFYPDIGMDPSTYFLAYARLAPVQAVGWGHPDTTGLDSMDYFVSAAPIEPPDADEHYTERLIRLNRMPSCYQPLVASTQIPGRPALGLPETGTLYGSPQSNYKFHPDFDAVLAAIAEGDPNGHIVLIEEHASWTKLLNTRWAIRYPVLRERVMFLPSMALERFMALMAHIDVLLDPIHFGSGNTLYEAMVHGTPIVTWPGRFMRGRIVAGAYRQIGLADAPIAERLEDYAPLALALGRDAERRQALRKALLHGTRELFADLRAVREFEVFLEAAVDAAARGAILPQGWRPPAPTIRTDST